MPRKPAERPASEITRYGTPVYRVLDSATDHTVTLNASIVDAEPDRYKILGAPAVDAAGTPLPPVYAEEPINPQEPERLYDQPAGQEEK